MAKPLGKANAFYVEQHAGTKTPAEIAEDLGVSVKSVESHLEKNCPEEAAVPQVPPAAPANTGFITQNGAVIMTQQAAMAHENISSRLTLAERKYVESQNGAKPAEEIAQEIGLDPDTVRVYIRQLATKGTNPEYMRRRGSGKIHKIRPDEPIH